MKNIKKYLNKIDEHIMNGEYDEALSLCENILNKIDFNNIDAIFKSAYCYYKTKKYDISLVYFEKALSLEDSKINIAMYEYYIGKCYYEYDAFEESKKHFYKAYSLDSENKYYSLWLGIVYSKLSKNDSDYYKALNYLEISLGSEDYLVYGHIGYCYLKLNKLNMAIEYLEKSLSLKDNYYLYRYYLGSAYFLVQKYDMALEHLNESVKFNENNFDAWFMLGQIYQVIDDECLYEECFENAREIAVEMTDNRELSVCYLKKLLDVQKNEYINYLYIGIFLIELENYNDALNYLLESIEIIERYSIEDDYLVYYWIGYINYRDMKYEEAVKYLEKSIRISNFQDDYNIRFWLGNSYLKIDNYKKSLFNFKMALEFEDDIEIYNTLSNLYMKIGDNDNSYECKKIYESLKEDEKMLEHEEFYQKLNDAYNNKKENNDSAKFNNIYEEYFNYLIQENNILDNDVFQQKAFENRIDIKYFYSKAFGFDFNSLTNHGEKTTDKIYIVYIITFLFHDIENSDLYNLYSSYTKDRKNYICLDDFNFDNFELYEKLIKKAVIHNFYNNTNDIKNIENIISFQDDVIICRKNIEDIIDNIEDIFDYSSTCILNSMSYLYKQYDIELYYILMQLLINNI